MIATILYDEDGNTYEVIPPPPYEPDLREKIVEALCIEGYPKWNEYIFNFDEKAFATGILFTIIILWVVITLSPKREIL